MIVTFDSNAYRNLVLNLTLDEAKKKIQEIKNFERKKNNTYDVYNGSDGTTDTSCGSTQYTKF